MAAGTPGVVPGPHDGFRGGVTTDESLDFTSMLEADGCLDALQLSGGSSLMNPMYLFRGETPTREFAAAMPAPVRLGMRTPVGKRFLKHYEFHEAYFLDKALRFRERLSMPLMLLGGINRRDTMERAMGHGFDFVAMGRALLREPDLVHRLQDERQQAGVCIHCNRCMPTIYSGTRCPVAGSRGTVNHQCRPRALVRSVNVSGIFPSSSSAAASSNPPSRS